MNFKIIIPILFGVAFANATTPVATSPTASFVPSPSRWKTAIDSLETLPNDLATKTTLAQAKVRQERLQFLASDDPQGPEYAVQWKACSLYVDIARVQSQSRTLRLQIDSVASKRIAVQKDIVKIQNQIIELETGKSSNLASDLEAQRQRLAQTAQQSAEAQEKLRREAAEREKALQQSLAEKEQQLAEERRKAEERQNDARKKLDALQSKLINVHKDARGIILSMSDILFDVNKATLTPDLKTSLAKIAGILIVYGESNVLVEGHTDNTGSADLNQKLSEQRAANVLQFMVEQGVAIERLKSAGFGFTRPVGDNNTLEGRQKNRRVDLVIQDKALQ